ncbi:augmin complex subunit dgt6 [Anopheles nili]|uniref:augmin complex subunit dgt6 n=1 Tax=Anopheles nili TaxID=185578 RepID=UPI00237BF2B1|nr:augmin complex subunit dgt6 [Anopheles nili]
MNLNVSIDIDRLQVAALSTVLKNPLAGLFVKRLSMRLKYLYRLNPLGEQVASTPWIAMSKKHPIKRTTSQLSVAHGSSNAPASRSEEQLDAAIYRCLHSLTKRHPPTEDFKAQFCRGAFVKPNTKAFIQVMHFLFNVYDAREFRKRFYWPIYDKGAENAFRTSTVEYVNSLIERGKLVGMEKIKAHVVVLPGGAKFMKFLLCLIRFVLQEELRRAKGGSSDSVLITNPLISQMVDSHRRWIEVGDCISSIVHEEVSVMSKSTQQIEDLIAVILQASEPARQLSYDKLMQLWGILIKGQFKEQQKLHHRMIAIAKELEHVLEKTAGKLKVNEISLPFTREQLKECLVRYDAQPGTELQQLLQDVFDENGKLNPIKLFLLFEYMLPSVERFFGGFCMKSPELMKFEQKELSKAVIKLDEIRHQIDMLQRNLPMLDDCIIRESPSVNGSPEVAKENFAIKNKLFCTPPIVMDFDAHVGDFHASAVGANGRSNLRLALLNKEDVQAMNARMKLLSVSTYQPRSPKPPQKHLKPTSDHPLQSSPVLFAVPRATRKEKLNPLTMLNRIKAQSQKQTPGGYSTSRACGAPANSTMNISTLSEMTLRPEFSSTLLGTPEKPAIIAAVPTPTSDEEAPDPANHLLQVPQQQLLHQQVKQVGSSSNVHSSPRLMAIYASSTTPTPKSTLSPKTLLRDTRSRTSAKRSSLIDNELVHTSPSGRLDSLIKPLEIPQDCKIHSSLGKISEPTCERDGANVSEEKTLSAENGSHLLELSRTLLAAGEPTFATNVDVARHQDLAFEGCKLEQQVDTEEDILFNISDAVLTDFE